MRILRSAFVGAAVLWAVALPLAPFAASRPHAAAPWYALAFVAYAVGSVICHQLPERSFHLWAAQMPVCARCTGIYVGAAVAAIAVAFRRTKVLRHISEVVAQGFSPAAVVAQDFGNSGVAQGFSPAKIALTIAAIPMVATLVFEWTTGHTPANWIRAAAGVPFGGAIASVTVRLKADTTYDVAPARK